MSERFLKLFLLAVVVLLNSCKAEDNAFNSTCPGEGDSDVLVMNDTDWPDCAADSYMQMSNLSYSDGSVAHKLDLYIPAKGSRPFPTVIWVHGGGWQSGSKLNVKQALWLVCEGFAVASVEYRLTEDPAGNLYDPPHHFPAQIHDIKAAIRFLRANAAAYSLDADRFASFGSSAGGHLAALAGTSGEVADLEDQDMGNGGFSSSLQATVAWFGPMQFSTMDEELDELAAEGICPTSASHHGEISSGESKLVGCAVGEAGCASAVARASPLTYVDATDPPFLLLHGDHDCVAPYQQSQHLYRKLRAHNVCATHRTVAGAAHSNDVSAWTSATVRQITLDFLRQALPDDSE